MTCRPCAGRWADERFGRVSDLGLQGFKFKAQASRTTPASLSKMQAEWRTTTAPVLGADKSDDRAPAVNFRWWVFVSSTLGLGQEPPDGFGP